MDYIKFHIKDEKTVNDGKETIMSTIGRFESNFADSKDYDLNLVMHALSHKNSHIKDGVMILDLGMLDINTLM